jgi:hypothetical protein
MEDNENGSQKYVLRMMIVFIWLRTVSGGVLL